MSFRSPSSALPIAALLGLGLLAAPVPPAAKASAEPPAPAPELVLVYTGSVEGRLEPCG